MLPDAEAVLVERKPVVPVELVGPAVPVVPVVLAVPVDPVVLVASQGHNNTE